VNLSSFAGQTIRLRVEAADAATASLIEAGVDDVQVTRS
jgi:aminopeptidase S